MEKETKLIMWNCHSLTTKLSRFKILLYTCKPHIACLTETWLNTKNQPNFINYRASWNHRTGRQGGGTAILIRNDVPVIDNKLELMENGSLEAQRVQVVTKSGKLDILNIYNPSQNVTSNEFSYYFSQLGKNKLVVGDFNGHHHMWTSKARSNQTGNNLVNSLIDFPDMTLVTPKDFPTYIGSRTLHQSTLDLSFLPSHWITKTRIEALNDCGSDHIPLEITLGIKTDCSIYKTRPKFKLDSNLLKSWSEKLKPIATHPELQKEYDNFIKNITESAENTFEKTKEMVNPRFSKPWWSKECENAVKEKKKARNRFKSHPTPENLILLRRAEAIVKRCCRTRKRKSWKEYCSTLTSTTDTRNVWKKVRKLTNTTSRVNNPIIIEDNIITDTESKVELIADEFQKNMTIPAPKRETNYMILPVALAMSDIENSLYDTKFSRYELDIVLAKLKDTSAGKDMVHNKLLKELPNHYKEWLLRLINRSYEENEIPKEWSEALIVPILKPNKPATNTASYRPISLLCCTAKIMEKLIVNRLEYHIEQENLLSNSQGGFRKRMCTLDQVVRLEQVIKQCLATKQICIVVYFDLSSAYDLIWHSGLIYKLAQCRVKNKMLRWIKTYLTNRKICIFQDGCYSSVRNIKSGVPQGSALSPLLFNIMMNDIPKEEDVYYSEYADDVAVYCKGKSIDTVKEKIQLAINSFHKWTKMWGLKINYSKTKAQLYTNIRIHPPSLQITGTPLEYVETQKFLGVDLDAPKLKWTQHIKNLKRKSLMKTNLLFSVSRFNWGADRTVLTRLYKMLIRSRLDYGTIFYSSASKKSLKSLDSIQNACLRAILGARKTSPATAMQVEANIPPLSLHRKELLLRYYCRLTELPKNAPVICDTFNNMNVISKIKWNNRIKPPTLYRAKTLFNDCNL